MTPGNLAAYASDELQLNDTMGWVDENVPQIRVPSVIIGGEDDHLVGIDHLRRLAETLPDTQLVTVDGSHMIPYTHPDVIAAQVKSASPSLGGRRGQHGVQLGDDVIANDRYVEARHLRCGVVVGADEMPCQVAEADCW